MDYETKLTEYAEKIIKLTVDIEQMEKNPDDYSEADLEEITVEIKQVEALIKELQLSINGSTNVFESLRVQVCPELQSCSVSPQQWFQRLTNGKPCVVFQITVTVDTLDRLEKIYDKNLVLVTRREYIKVQLQLEECERRHQELFNPNIGKMIYTIMLAESPLWTHD